jgi:hypothetical protein
MNATTTANPYKIQVVKTGVNFGYYARITQGRKLIRTSLVYPHDQAARDAADRWIAKQGQSNAN